MVQRLRHVGMLLREAEPDEPIVDALAGEVVSQFSCCKCEQTGLEFCEDPFGDDAWPEAKACVACGEIIPSERIELFPAVERCATCQSAAESGNPVGNDREFCPRCGDVMKMRMRHGRVAKYEMHCAGCGAVQ